MIGSYSVWLKLGTTGALTRWRRAGQADDRAGATKVAAAARAAAGHAAVLAIEYRPPPADA